MFALKTLKNRFQKCYACCAVTRSSSSFVRSPQPFQCKPFFPPLAFLSLSAHTHTHTHNLQHGDVPTTKSLTELTHESGCPFQMSKEGVSLSVCLFSQRARAPGGELGPAHRRACVGQGAGNTKKTSCQLGGENGARARAQQKKAAAAAARCAPPATPFCILLSSLCSLRRPQAHCHKKPHKKNTTTTKEKTFSLPSLSPLPASS